MWVSLLFPLIYAYYGYYDYYSESYYGSDDSSMGLFFALLLLLLVYLVFSVSVWKLLEKVGEGSKAYRVMAWIPIFQVFSLGKVAGLEDVYHRVSNVQSS